MNSKNASKWFVPALAATIAGVLAYGITRHVVCRAAGTELEHLHDLSFLKRELKLTATQVDEIKALHRDLASRLSDISARHCRARIHLGNMLASETNGCTRADAALNEMCRAYEDSERATLDHIRRVRDVLDPAQREKFDRMLKECLCLECPSCGAAADYVSDTEHER